MSMKLALHTSGWWTRGLFKNRPIFGASLARVTIPPAQRSLWRSSNRRNLHTKNGIVKKKRSHGVAVLVVGAFVLSWGVVPALSALSLADHRNTPIPMFEGEPSEDDEAELSTQIYGETLFAQAGAIKVRKEDSINYRELLYRRDIRLLFLQPGTNDDRIVCSLEHVSLRESHPRFQALSYAWGSHDLMCEITCCGETIKITANLHKAIVGLRRADAVRILWVDSVCIDQHDENERYQQVRIIGDVFRKANRVLIWLGEERLDTDSAFSSLWALHRFFWRQNQPSKLSERLISRFLRGSQRESDNPRIWYNHSLKQVLRLETRNETISNFDWPSLISLFHRPWFHRLWVIQEVANSRRAMVVCGQKTIPWCVVANVCRNLAYHRLTPRILDGETLRACENVAIMDMAKKKRSVPEPLFHLVLSTSGCECSDPRDKIFAVMSIATDRDLYDWEVSMDYSLSIEELFKRFAIWDIMRGNCLRALSCASAPSCDTERFLPSWVPDWRTVPNPHPFLRYSNTTSFNASGRMENEFWFSHGNNVLHVKGHIVDSVDRLGQVPWFIKSTSLFEIDDEAINDMSMAKRWLQECSLIAAEGNVDPSTQVYESEALAGNDQRRRTAIAFNPDKPLEHFGQNLTTMTGIPTGQAYRSMRGMPLERYEEFWRTMTCGLTGRGYPAPSEYSFYFSWYLDYINFAPALFKEFLTSPAGELRSDWYNEYFETNSLIEASLSLWSGTRRFCSTIAGRLGCVPKDTERGDIICIIYGSEVPYVLRPCGNGDYWVVGECYVQGVMHGEAMIEDIKPRYFLLR